MWATVCANEAAVVAIQVGARLSLSRSVSLALCVCVCVLCVCVCAFVLYCNTPENELTGEARARRSL